MKGFWDFSKYNRLQPYRLVLTPPQRRATASKMPAGRPSLYDPKYCDEVIEDMGAGYSMTAFAGKIGVCRDTLQEWASVQPEFSAALKVGKSVRTRFLENGLLNEELGPRVTARIFALKNAAPDEWRDRHEHVGADGGPIQVTVARFTGESDDGASR